jgi:hypothetical protein
MNTNRFLHSSTSTRHKVLGGMFIGVILFFLSIQNHQLGFYRAEDVGNSFLSDVNLASQDYSALQAEALLHGSLSVLPTPPELLLLADPYDPAQNEQVRLRGYHDLSFYDGQIFAPQGFGASLIIDLPTRLIGLGYASPPLKVLLLVALGTYFLFLLCLDLLHRYKRSLVSPIQTILLLFTILLSNPVTWLLVPGRTYQVPNAAAYFAFNLGSWLIWAGLVFNREKRLIFGSLFLGLGFAARPNMILWVILIYTVFIIFIWRKNSPRIDFKSLAMLSVPLLTVIVFWCLFNYLRFDGYTETGHAFQLAGFNMPKYPIGSVSFIPQNMKAYLLTPLDISRNFPFFSLSPNNTSPVLNIQGHESLGGLLVTYPLLCLSPVTAIFLFRREEKFLLLSLSLMGASIGTLGLLSAIFKDSTMRYVPDFSMGLVLLTGLTICLVFEALQGHKGIYLRFFSFFVCCTFAIQIGVLLTPCNNC